MRMNNCKGSVGLSKEQIITTLKGLGLLRTDAEIYLYLAIKGRQRAKDIAEGLNLPTHQIYNSLKRLRKQEIVTVSHEQVTTFSAEAFEKIMDSCVRIKLHEAEKMGERRKLILSNWRLMMAEKDTDT